VVEDDDKPKRPRYLPPGFHLLIDDVAAMGAEAVRERHAAGVPAYYLNSRTNKPEEILQEEWWSNQVPDMLERGTYFLWVRHYGRHTGPRRSLVEHHILVRDKPAPVVSTPDEPVPPSATDEPAPRRQGGGGRKPEYDWEVIRAYCDRRFYDDGPPENASDFCKKELIPWCEDRYGEEGTPELDTLRKFVGRWKAAWLRMLLPE
jgi:hypothetical protein